MQIKFNLLSIVCLYIKLYIYIYIYTNICAHVYTWYSLHLYMYIYIYLCTYIRVQIRTDPSRIYLYKQWRTTCPLSVACFRCRFLCWSGPVTPWRHGVQTLIDPSFYVVFWSVPEVLLEVSISELYFLGLWYRHENRAQSSNSRMICYFPLRTSVVLASPRLEEATPVSAGVRALDQHSFRVFQFDYSRMAWSPIIELA